MRRASFRKGKGFHALGAAIVAIVPATPVKAQGLVSAYMSGVAPIAIAAGALGFGLAAAVLLVRARQHRTSSISRANAQIAQLRSELDEVQAILEGMPEITVRWRGLGAPPAIFGPTTALLPEGMPHADVLEFDTWLNSGDAEVLRFSAARLRSAGEGFDLNLTAKNNQPIRATGRIVGGAAVLRLRSGRTNPRKSENTAAETSGPADCAGAGQLFAELDLPAIIRNTAGEVVSINDAATALAADLGRDQLFSPAETTGQLEMLAKSAGPVTISGALKAKTTFDLVLLPLANGSLAYLRPVPAQGRETGLRSAEFAEIGAIIDALATPIAIFDVGRNLVQFNRAYTKFWDLEPGWLKPGISEQAVLDRLRTKGLLPAEVDYRGWRAEHLKSYGLAAPRETLWHLPNGRAVNVSAVPATSTGGVIYVFQDMTERLALESRYNALNRVQSETLNALSEGVAVFGTNGKLTLFNPRLSSLWKLPTNELARHPHIDQVAAACAEAMPEDGAVIWRDLKLLVIDLNPGRADRSGRINRADGRLIDYASVRLPDGQTLLTFVDVTESTNYQRVLKERNDALINADRLKDAFVQNVSYEFRSPLTNIIGFADILASGGAGDLNEKQKSYTDYIRASSATLGLLIDNILDLATVDAGIAQLELAPQDIAALVEQARAGIAATLSVGTGESPLNLVVDIDPALPEFVADGTRIVQILYNLLSNAARFSEGGSEVRLSVKARGKDRLLFIIEDEGVGIPDDVKAAMFQRFEGRTSEGRQRGAGLGLTIVRTFVNLHGGTIQVEDRRPKGTRVVVNLPARADSAAGAAE